MEKKILKLMSFRLSGKFAAFRKFYSNSSSLSYYIPPRTALIGMFASILEIARNEYYEIFSPKVCGISVCIETPLKRKIHSMNYLDNIDGLISQHSQCKLEVVSAKDGGLIRYRVYLAANDDSFLSTFEDLAKHIESQNLGYGIYLGQRQFIAEIDEFHICDAVQYLEKSREIHSICREDHVVSFESEDGIILCSDNIPLDMIKTENEQIRKTTRSERIVYEQNGKVIKGEFQNCYKAEGKVISFFE